MRLNEKVAIITGGNSGIGRATAILFASEGAKIVIADLKDSKKDETLAKIAMIGGEAIFTKSDVAQIDDVNKMIELAVDTYGGLDVLFNNAGTAGRGETLTQRWNDAIAVNLSSMFHASVAAIDHMKARGGGSIINTASIAGTQIGFGVAQYDASKAGVAGLTRHLASELGIFNIRVNSISPGLIDTPLVKDLTGNPERMRVLQQDIALQRAGTPEEVAQVVLFLASDESSYITGTSIVIDGGWMIHGRKYWKLGVNLQQKYLS